MTMGQTENALRDSGFRERGGTPSCVIAQSGSNNIQVAIGFQTERERMLSEALEREQRMTAELLAAVRDLSGIISTLLKEREQGKTKGVQNADLGGTKRRFRGYKTQI